MEDAQMTDVPKDQDLIKLISLLIETYDTKIIDHYPKEALRSTVDRIVLASNVGFL